MHFHVWVRLPDRDVPVGCAETHVCLKCPARSWMGFGSALRERGIPLFDLRAVTNACQRAAGRIEVGLDPNPDGRFYAHEKCRQ